MADKAQQFNPDQLRAGAEDAFGEPVSQFSNNAVVTMTNDHVVLEFQFAFTPTGGKTVNKMLSRIIMTPSHAKRYLKTLARNIKAYEDTFGSIPDYIVPKPKSKPKPPPKPEKKPEEKQAEEKQAEEKKPEDEQKPAEEQAEEKQAETDASPEG